MARNDHLTAPRDTPLTLNVLVDHGSGADSDVDGQLVDATLVPASGPAHGTLVSSGAGVFVYSPQPGFGGTDSFQYQVRDDDSALSNVATVTIVVNTPPVAHDDLVHSIEDLPVTIDVLANNGQGMDLDVNGTLDASSVQPVTGPSHGTLVQQSNGTFRYTPELHFTGVDLFTYTVADNEGEESNVATVTINVAQGNLPPLGRDDTIVTNEDTAITFNVLDNQDQGSEVDLDIDGALRPASVVNVSWPAVGGLSNYGDGRFRFTPPANFHGTVSFSYIVRDDDGASTKVYEAITEELTNSGQQSRLEHVWSFDVTAGDAQAFVVSGFHDSETEDFGFDYSTDGANWTPMTVRLTNAAQLREFALPAGIRGVLQVRVTDSNRSLGDTVADTAYIEHMYIRSAPTVHPELPQLSVSDPIVTEAPGGTAVAQFIVTRSGDSSGSVTFAYETVNGSAEANADYAPIGLRTALLGPGVTQRIISVPILDDTLAESAETFFLRLSRAVGANLGDAEGQATIGASDNPPHVTSVLVGSSSWSSDFRSQALGATGGFYRIPMDTSQLRIIPWEIDQIRIVFDADVNVAVSDLVVTNAAQLAVDVQRLEYANGIATWSISQVSADKVLLNVSDRIIASSSGLRLDGEFVTASGIERSGNGSDGGAFNFRINILAGDINGDNLVGSSDLSPLGKSYLKPFGDPVYNIFADLNGDGLVGSSADLLSLSRNYLRSTPSTLEPQLHQFSPTYAAVAQRSPKAEEADQFFLGFAVPAVFQRLSSDDEMSLEALTGLLGNRNRRNKPGAYMA